MGSKKNEYNQTWTPAISAKEFAEHIEEENFFLRYGNPVRIITADNHELICIAIELYERIFGMKMFHKAVKLEMKEGTVLELTFQDGKVKQYDMSVLFSKYPQLTALKDRNLFLSGQLMGGYGIVWNDELDIEVETIYEDGISV